MPRIPVETLLTIDLNGSATAYAEFWNRGVFFRVQNEEVERLALESLALDYYFKQESAPLPTEEFAHGFSIGFLDDTFAAACRTLLQLGHRARIRILVDPKKSLLSCVIGCSSDESAVLAQYFPNVRAVSPREYGRLARGRHLFPRRLTKLTLPALPGVDDAGPLPFDVPNAQVNANGVRLGEIVSPFNNTTVAHALLTLDLVNRHGLVTGTTGSGKTNTCLQLVRALRPHASVLVFDAKRDYRTLHRDGATVLEFSGANLFSCNLLKPVGAPALWIKQFSSILAEIISRPVVATGSKDILIEELDRLFRERGVYEGSRDFPHVGDLVDALLRRAGDPNTSRREQDWLASALRVLKSLLVGSTREAFCVRDGLGIERLLTGVTVIELDEIGDASAESLIMAVVLQKIRNRLADRPSAGLRHVIVLEEAQRMLAKGAEASSTLLTTAREIRSSGVGLIYVTQVPSEFSKHAVANVGYVVTHQLVHPDDKTFMANVLGLDRAQSEIIERLKVGEAILRTDALSLVRVPEVERPHVRDDELPPVRVEREDVATNFARRASVTQRLDRLTPDEREVFELVARGEAVQPSRIARQLKRDTASISTRLGTLIRLGLCAYVSAKKSGSGRPGTVYFLTPDGYETFRQIEERYPDRKKRTADHTEMQDRVVATLGIARKPSQPFDIIYDTPAGERAIEVETGSNNDVQLTENVRKSMERYGEARFVVADETTANRVLQAAARCVFDGRPHVKLVVATVDDLTPDAWETFLLPWKTVPSTP